MGAPIAVDEARRVAESQCVTSDANRSEPVNMSSSQAMSSAAFEIVKGERRIPFVSEREVERCLGLRQLLDGLQAGSNT